MKNFKSSVLAGSLLCLSLTTQAVASCNDDPRLYSIGSFLEEQGQGSAAPLELTAETYLQLTPTAREAIGDNLVLFDVNCKPMQVFKGEPAMRVELPFPLIYNAFYDSVLRGDTVTQGVILRSFKAAPVDAMEFMSLMSAISIEPALANRLAQAANLSVSVAVNRNGNRCDDGDYLTFADLFNRFGGSVYGRNGKAWFAVSGARFISSVDYDVTMAIPVNDCYQSHNDIVSRITEADALAWLISRNNSGSQHNYTSNNTNRSHIQAKYAQWVEDGSPDTGPTSLFD